MPSVYVNDARLKKSFETICVRLRQPEFAEQVLRPLNDWVRPSDRCLPVPFLERSVQELVNTPFVALSHSASVGPKKMAVLVTLLRRMAADSSKTGSRGKASSASEGEETAAVSADDFQAELVTEVIWEKWRETVVRFDLGNQYLGTLARSLNRLPTVLWRTPLQQFVDQSLGELRAQKTFGRKRVAVVLEVFHDVHATLGSGTLVPSFDIELKPRFARVLETWLRKQRQAVTAIKSEQLVSGVVEPILAQLAHDCGPNYVELIRQRLGLGTEILSVRQQSQRYQVTRARIYQMLDECSAVLAVRWPTGKCQFHSFQQHLLAQSSSEERTMSLLKDLTELLYPQEYEAIERHLRPHLAS